MPPPRPASTHPSFSFRSEEVVDDGIGMDVEDGRELAGWKEDDGEEEDEPQQPLPIHWDRPHLNIRRVLGHLTPVSLHNPTPRSLHSTTRGVRRNLLSQTPVSTMAIPDFNNPVYSCPFPKLQHHQVEFHCLKLKRPWLFLTSSSSMSQEKEMKKKSTHPWTQLHIKTETLLLVRIIV